MTLEFYKYHGTGNDFVIVDNRAGQISLNQKQIQSLCKRRFGIGADGLMLLELAEGFDFKMVYYNSDGQPSSMCGNGGRCLVKFAQDVGQIKDTAHFTAVDGEHHAVIRDGRVELHMADTQSPVEKDSGDFLDTGSPHHILRVEDAKKAEVFMEGRKLRHEIYGVEGANINFVEVQNPKSIFVRTYERGVEDETYSCGTGVTASAIIAYNNQWVNTKAVGITTLGGPLEVTFEPTGKGFEKVWLKGPVVHVYMGTIEI